MTLLNTKNSPTPKA